MKKKAILIIMLLVLTAFATLSSATVEEDVLTNPVPPGCVIIDFEDGVNGTVIQSTITGLNFTTTFGYDWLYGDEREEYFYCQSLTEPTDPVGAYVCNGYFFAWLGVSGDIGRIDFTEGTASYFSILVSTASGLTVDAYDSSDTLIATSGWANSNINTLNFTRLTIEQPGMAYVLVHDTGNYWLLDDLVTDAPGVGRILEKTLSDDELELGDITHVTINVSAREGETVWVGDEFPPELDYVEGSFMVDGVPVTPSDYGTIIWYNLTGPGYFIIEFDLKVKEAKSWEETDGENWAYSIWYNESDIMVDSKADYVNFTLLPFEELQKYVEDIVYTPKVDVVFSFDLTGSMSGYLSQLQTQASDIINYLQSSIYDVAFGVLTHVDYPYYYDTCGYAAQYGDNDGNADGYGDIFGDYAYNKDLDITDNAATAISTIQGLTTYNGMDRPQDYTRVLYETTQDISWRTDATRIVILFGDDIPHDCDYWDWSTGVDPGRDAIAGNADDLDFQTVVGDVASAGIKVLGVDCSFSNQYAAFYQYLADETDGAYYNIGLGSVLDAVQTMIDEVSIIFESSPLIVPVKTEQQWAMVIEVENPYGYNMEDVVVSDRLAGDLELHDELSLVDTTANTDAEDIDPIYMSQGDWTIWTQGNSKKVFIEWNVGDLEPGETAQLVFLVSTDINTGTGHGKKPGHQEYTSSGWHELNSGATLKFYDEDGDLLSAYTDSIEVLAYNDMFTVDSSIIDGYDFKVKTGKTYNFLVTGTWLNSPIIAVDAEYTSNDDWATYRDGAPPANVNQFDLQIDEAFVDWGAYADNHYYYYYDYVAPSNTINFRVFEGNTVTNTPNSARYSNNIGELTVYIF